MKYYVITDTHFGHEKMVEYCGRPSNFGMRIRNGILSTLGNNDILIHLGDICIGQDEYFHDYLMSSVPFNSNSLWLIRGNHDKKSNTWYLNHGWDFVGNGMSLHIFGERILLSHTPQPIGQHTVNVHGHFHNSDHHRWEPEIKAVMGDKHRLVMMEHHYLPQDLRKIVGR
jgi:calcineurin-like phosphoesterase family protein